MNDDWLSHPAVQAAILPFVVALMVAVLLRRGRFAGLAIVAGFVTLLAVTIGFSFESLAATRKMVLAGLGATVVAVGLEMATVGRESTWRAAMAAAGGMAGVWTVWRVLEQKPMSAALLAGAAAAVYMAVLIDATARLRESAVRSTSAALLLGLGAAVAAFFGASAWLTQAGVALAGGATALLLVVLVWRTPSPLLAGWVTCFPVSVVAGLICLLAVFVGGLSWYAILPVLVLPWLFALARRRAG